MRFFRAKVFLISLATITFGASFLVTGCNGQKIESSTPNEVKVLIFKKSGGQPNADDLLTLAAVLKSRLILDRAVKKGELASLGAFAKADDTGAALQTGLSVTRDPDASNVITITFRGASPEDGVKILSAVLECYVEYLDKQYRSASDEMLEATTKARDILRKDIAEIQEKQNKLIQISGPSTKTGLGISIERLQTLERKRTELLIRETELRAVLKQAEGDDARPGLQIEAHAWAAKIGFEKLPKAVQSLGSVTAYKEHLKEKRDQLAAFGMALNSEMLKQRDHVKEMTSYDLKEGSLRLESERTMELFEGTVKRLKEISIQRDTIGFSVHVLTGPKGLRAP